MIIPLKGYIKLAITTFPMLEVLVTIDNQPKCINVFIKPSGRPRIFHLMKKIGVFLVTAFVAGLSMYGQ